MKKTVNDLIALEMLQQMPHEKKQALANTITRNYMLTSDEHIDNVRIEVYKEGWYLIITGTRCQFAVWAGDNDGEYVFTRKPNAGKLHKLYGESLYNVDAAEAIDWWSWA